MEFNMRTLNLTPAYGRTYVSPGEMYADWLKGKDFRGESGYTSINEIDTLRGMGYKQIRLTQGGYMHVGLAI